jgi:L,D-transpeptidase YcbB
MHSGNENTVKLTEHIPVHIMYMTAWTSPDGAIHVGKDIYDLQKKGQ